MSAKTRKKRKLKILKRDNYLCGIHLSGCRKEIRFDEATIDHIIPKNILKTFPVEDRRKIEKNNLNFQPMCSECNNDNKKGEFSLNEHFSQPQKCSCHKISFKKEKDKIYLEIYFRDDEENLYGKILLPEFTIKKEKNGIEEYIFFSLLGKIKHQEKNKIGFGMKSHGALVEKNVVYFQLYEQYKNKNPKLALEYITECISYVKNNWCISKEDKEKSLIFYLTEKSFLNTK